ncbi:hypothetical protein SUDANB145_07107 [Streptomyces sp. enrichment culture]|uniref:hypothetical protein n=1 Tax=Streptomyces sp. enrichment culture TaxID=1795815 RepID=UPI003F57B735
MRERTRDEAAQEAYMWARAAGELRRAQKDGEAARKLSNTPSVSLTEWQRWLLDHLAPEIDQSRAIDLAVMWARVAAVQPTDDV